MISLSFCVRSCHGVDAASRRGRRSSDRQDGQGIGSTYPNHEEPATRQPPSAAPYPSTRASRALRRHDTIPSGRHPQAPSAPNDHVVSGPSRRSQQYPASVSHDVQVVHLIPANVTYDPIPVSPALLASPSRGITPWHGATPQSSGALYDPGFTTAHLPPLSVYDPTTSLPYTPEFPYGPDGGYQPQVGAFLDPVAQYALDQELTLGRFENLTPEPPALVSWNGRPTSQQAIPLLNPSYGAEYLMGSSQGIHIQSIPTYHDLSPTMLGGIVAVPSQPNFPWPSYETGYSDPSFSEGPYL